jgi:parallel beta-helix repeat protein
MEVPMRQPSRFSLLFAVPALLLALALRAAAFVPGAPTCGPGDPCECGDRVTASTTLAPGDPVCTTVCSENGLFVADGVTLDLGGCTITGDQAGDDVGLTIEGGASNVVIRNGRVKGFGTGIATWTTTAGSTLASLQIVENGDGVRIAASGSTVRNSVLQRNDGHCLAVSGWGNAVSANRCEDSGGKGVVVEGTLNTISANTAMRGGLEGFDIDGSQNTVSQNRASDNFGEGFRFRGSGHTVTLNYSLRNEDDGYTVEAMASRFDRNRGDYNIGWGILDTTMGTGTGGTANTYLSTNRCTGNLLGKSFPSGLCR